MRPEHESEDVAAIMGKISREVSHILQPHPEVAAEFELLFSKALGDPPMAIARALAGYSRFSWSTASSGSRNRMRRMPTGCPILKTMIEKLTDDPPYSKELASVSHAVRLEGNRVLHYEPGHPVCIEVSPRRLDSRA